MKTKKSADKRAKPQKRKTSRLKDEIEKKKKKPAKIEQEEMQKKPVVIAEEQEDDHAETTNSDQEPSEHEEEQMDDGLSAIYDKEDMDFSTIDREKRSFSKLLVKIIIILAIIAALGWGAFFVYNQFFRTPQAEQFAIEVNTNDTLISGEPTEIVIHYDNLTRTPLASLELDVRLPRTFVITSMSPEPDNREELTWNIGNIAGYSDGMITVTGVWIAEVPSSTPIQVLANYRPANFNADFQTIETRYIETTESRLAVQFEGPKEATAGQEISYTVKVKNESTVPQTQAFLEVEMSEGFFMKESSPALEVGAPSIWELIDLQPDEEREITFTGTFDSETEGFQYFNAITFLKQDEEELVQSKTQGFTDVLASDLVVQLITNGGIDHVYPKPGDTLRVTISYENTGEAPVTNGTLLLDFNSEKSPPINWNNANLAGGTVTSDGILWSKTAFGTLQPGEEKILNLSFPLNSTINSELADTFVMTAIATVDQGEARSSEITASINAAPELISQARYFNDDGAPLGSGPHPPKVGEETTYRIYWEIENDLHALENVTVSATLPPNVTWVGETNQDAGNITYEGGTNIVRWHITSLSDDLTTVGANFRVRITPEEDDVGTFIKLLSGSILSGVDSSTKKNVESTTGTLTTELTDDEHAPENAVVVE